MEEASLSQPSCTSPTSHSTLQLHTSKSFGAISCYTNNNNSSSYCLRETTFPVEDDSHAFTSECTGEECACQQPSEAKTTVVGAKRLPWQRFSTSMEFYPSTLVGSSDSGLGMSARSGDLGGKTACPNAGMPIPQVLMPTSTGAGSTGSLEDTCAQCQQHRLGLHASRLSNTGHNNNIPPTAMDSNRLKPHDPSSPCVRPKLSGLTDWRDARTDTSSDTGDHHSNNSGVKSDDQNVVMRRRPRKTHVHRSRSDLTKRFSNSSDLSELSARFSRNSADLEKFFNEMGLDRAVLEPMLNAQGAFAHSSSNLHLFESASSLDSPGNNSWCSEDNDNDSTRPGGGGAARGARAAEPPLVPSTDVLKGAPVQTSIVERNARIIKWLCNVKKASLEEDE